MVQLDQQNAPRVNVGERVATLCRWAEDLCRRIVPRDLGDTPLYIVPLSQIQSMLGGPCACDGYTSPSLDLYLRNDIGPAWRGRGPCLGGERPGPRLRRPQGHRTCRPGHGAARTGPHPEAALALPRTPGCRTGAAVVRVHRDGQLRSGSAARNCPERIVTPARRPVPPHGTAPVPSGRTGRHRRRPRACLPEPPVRPVERQRLPRCPRQRAGAVGRLDDPRDSENHRAGSVRPPVGERPGVPVPRGDDPMNLTTLFDTIAGKQKQREQALASDFRGLVTTIATGKQPGPTTSSASCTTRARRSTTCARRSNCSRPAWRCGRT
jgi:hypothetical protein